MSSLAQLFGVLVLVGLVIKYWWVVALALFAVWVWRSAPKAWARHQAAVAAENRRLAAIAARADQQHAWALAGDPRGTYGEFVP
ncbi:MULTISPECIES: hypothetical protein [unclassified Mycolicibacterium]|uniref:hypothetical protein n=1 Tax=unclassified Mycolicibacterium TaxID=2636767 RepID=UPI002ED9D550